MFTVRFCGHCLTNSALIVESGFSEDKTNDDKATDIAVILKKSINTVLCGLFPTSHHYFARADGFDDVVLGKHADCGFDFWAIAGDHYDHRGRGEIDGFAVEVLDDLQCARAFFCAAEDLDEDELFGDGVVTGVLKAMNDIDELAYLHDDLLKPGGISGDADRHS